MAGGAGQRRTERGGRESDPRPQLVRLGHYHCATRARPFAGHPPIGTASVLVSERPVSSPATQTVAAGEFAVEVDVSAIQAGMRQLPAVFGGPLSPPEREDVAAALGLDAARLRDDV